MGLVVSSRAHDQSPQPSDTSPSSTCNLTRPQDHRFAYPTLPVRVRQARASGQPGDHHDTRRRSEESSKHQQKVVVPRRARSNTSSLVKADEAGGPSARADECDDNGCDEPPQAFLVENIVGKMLELLTPSSHLEAKLKDLSAETSNSLGRACPLPLFALALGRAASSMGCRLAIRRVINNELYWSSCMGSTFIVCALPPAASGHQQEQQYLIINPGFKDIFTTPQMTDRYRQVWSSLPDVFVGHVHHLLPLLRLLCYEMTLMFESLGRHLPPWRSFEVLASRWMSNSCEDVAVPTTGLQAATRMQVGLFLAETKRLLEGQPVRSCTQPKGVSRDLRVHSGVTTKLAAAGPAELQDTSRALPGCAAAAAACTVTVGFCVKPNQEAR